MTLGVAGSEHGVRSSTTLEQLAYTILKKTRSSDRSVNNTQRPDMKTITMKAGVSRMFVSCSRVCSKDVSSSLS